MPEPDPKIKELEDRLDRLVRTQVDFQKEISLIRGELIRLRAESADEVRERPEPSFYEPDVSPTPVVRRPELRKRISPDEPYVQGAAAHSPEKMSSRTSSIPADEYQPSEAQEKEPLLSEATTESGAFSRFISQYTEGARANLEEFVGKNLISLIGIVVLILGVGIGAKYAIDNNLISPLTRIVIGYAFGFGLVAFAIKLRRRYTGFSAVLISGGMAIMYFVTFFAYSAYGLISQLPTFALMVMFTIFTVGAAFVYSRQVIAHIGLVGAYAVPFLLSNDSGNYLALFGYMTVINAGILGVSIKKAWKPIFYTASVFTWLIYCGWYFSKYDPSQHFYLAIGFLGVFFAILYGSKLVQVKFLKDEEDHEENIIASTVTVGIFYAMSFAIASHSAMSLASSVQFLAFVAGASLFIVVASLVLTRYLLSFWMAAFAGFAVLGGWYATSYVADGYLGVGLIFLTVFFAIAYGATLMLAASIEAEQERNANRVVALLIAAVLYVFLFAFINDPNLGTREYWTLFTYLAVASGLILATSFKHFGRTFVYIALPLTWAIYGFWFISRYDWNEQFTLAAIFATLFFALFYISVLYHRLVRDDFTLVEHSSLVLSNAFIAYGFGYTLMDGHDSLRDYLGLFTAFNGLLHLAVAMGIRTLKASAVDVVQVLTILVLTFVSLAVPVQFDGNAVTMLWAIEAAVLFWFGRTRGVRLFERYSYPVMLLAVGRLGLDWVLAYTSRNSVTPFVNSDFVTAAVFVIAFGFIYLTNRKSDHEAAMGRDLVRPFGILVAVVGWIVLFNMFRMEIGNYFYLASVKTGGGNTGLIETSSGDLQRFNIAWQISYLIAFLAGMAALNLKKVRSFGFGLTNTVVSVLALGLFASVSMFIFHELRLIFMSGTFEPDFISHWMYIAIRPISYLIAATLLYLIYRYTRDGLLDERVDPVALRYGFDAVAYTFVFIVASCELINLMGQLRLPDSTKLGLSILWGIYALVLVVVGIAKDKKHLRIAAMTVLGITLVKLFFYDIADLDTIPKTILFVTLGITLLLISFLYNKYKSVIFDSDSTQEDVELGAE